jgi:hypothetical protein
MIAQTDDPEMLEWLANAEQKAGGFLSTFARAAMHADAENYPVLRPALVVFRKRYPLYEPSEEVKREISARSRT